jgi:hypothetical protein
VKYRARSKVGANRFSEVGEVAGLGSENGPFAAERLTPDSGRRNLARMALGKDDQFDGPYTPRPNDATDYVVPGFETNEQGPSARDRLLVALRDSGMSYRQMANALGLTSADGLRVSVSKARRKLKAVGFLYQTACDRLDQEIVPLAVERLAGMVQAGVPEAVFRTLDGRGIFRQHRTGNEAPPSANTNLTISFQTVSNSPTVAAGSIVGAPRPMLGVPAPAPALPLPDLVVQTVKGQ